MWRVLHDDGDEEELGQRDIELSLKLAAGGVKEPVEATQRTYASATQEEEKEQEEEEAGKEGKQQSTMELDVERRAKC